MSNYDCPMYIDKSVTYRRDVINYIKDKWVFFEATIIESSFWESSFKNTLFRSVTLLECRFIGSVFCHSLFSSCHLVGVSFVGSDLSGCSFHGCTFKNVKLTQKQINSLTKKLTRKQRKGVTLR